MALVSAQIVKAFQQQFGRTDRPALYRAPGRVNLIGEHTDYNLGFVFPIALEMACTIAIAPAGHGELRVYSRDTAEEFRLNLAALGTAKATGKWHDYVVGVAQQLQAAGIEIDGADLYVASEVPVGSGLSSSAALEVSTAFALLAGRGMEPLALAQLAQRAETQFVGMPCGIMDQYASVFGREQSAVQIDCRSLTHEYVRLPDNVKIIAVNSQVKHELGTSAYRERVAECAAAVKAIQKSRPEVRSLRDVDVQYFAQVQDSVPVVPRRRARHIITDSQRVLDLAAAARASDLREMGRLFVASHRSMQYDYEITCPEIDFLVDTAIQIGGVWGSRMTGGGFGGCTVNLIEPAAEAEFKERVASAYLNRYSIQPLFYDCVPAIGAHRVE